MLVMFIEEKKIFRAAFSASQLKTTSISSMFDAILWLLFRFWHKKMTPLFLLLTTNQWAINEYNTRLVWFAVKIWDVDSKNKQRARTRLFRWGIEAFKSVWGLAGCQLLLRSYWEERSKKNWSIVQERYTLMWSNHKRWVGPVSSLTFLCRTLSVLAVGRWQFRT